MSSFKEKWQYISTGKIKDWQNIEQQINHILPFTVLHWYYLFNTKSIAMVIIIFLQYENNEQTELSKTGEKMYTFSCTTCTMNI